MKLLSLTLNNFRQFAGENTVEFGDSNKVTVIYGLNGYGKQVFSCNNFLFIW